MISRIWHGWTSPENADAYESLLKTEIFQGIRDRQIDGYRGIHLLRRDLEDETEFVTIMWFDSVDAVRTFAGEDYEVAVVPPKARALLSRFDARSQHYEVKVEMEDNLIATGKRLLSPEIAKRIEALMEGEGLTLEDLLDDLDKQRETYIRDKYGLES
jgi:heme-degrading monooxygenase HmoA